MTASRKQHIKRAGQQSGLKALTVSMQQKHSLKVPIIDALERNSHGEK